MRCKCLTLCRAVKPIESKIFDIIFPKWNIERYSTVWKIQDLVCVLRSIYPEIATHHHFSLPQKHLDYKASMWMQVRLCIDAKKKK